MNLALRGLARWGRGGVTRAQRDEMSQNLLFQDVRPKIFRLYADTKLSQRNEKISRGAQTPCQAAQSLQSVSFAGSWRHFPFRFVNWKSPHLRVPMFGP